MGKILVIEDDKACSSAVIDLLRHEGHEVELAEDGTEGTDRLKLYSYDLVIVDWELPGISGLQLCQNFRRSGGSTPLLMLTGRDAYPDRELGLDTGADDYLVKPFNARELLAHVRALLRREWRSYVGDCRTVGDIVMHRSKRQVHNNGVELELLPKEFAVLEYMMLHPDEVLTLDTILNSVWSSESDSSPEAARKVIERLRKKLGQQRDGSSLIHTVHRIGYVLKTPSPTNSD